jgi:uncharacterized protein YdeI (YjbR/CyaY-like superfamily)
MITDPDDFFAKGCGRCARFDTAECSTKLWAAGLARLRALCLEAGLSETAKWGHPCYVQGERNVAILGAFRGDFRLTFFHAALMTDPEGVLTKQGPNTQNAGVLRFTSNAGPDAMANVIRAYLAEAAGYAERGVLPPKEAREIDLPDELLDALDADAELAEAFAALTPGRQRSYVIALASAKKSETRVARILKFRDRILAGKGATER